MAFRNHRNTGNDPLNYRLLRAQRMFEGKYDPEKLAAIKVFGGSEVYARIVATKCRGATGLLRDVYLGPDRPWDIEPQPDPPVPPDIKAGIMALISAEVGSAQQAGQPVEPTKTHMRYVDLMHAAEQASRRNALEQATSAADKMDDILRAGNFYKSLTEFLTDLPLFPFACLKGPVVRMVPKLTWTNGKPALRNKAQMFWERVSPFDVYWSPGASRIEDAEVIERKRLSRTDLNDLLGLPGYDETAVRAALQDYDNGLRDWLDYPDTEQALNEGRENPYLNQSQLIDSAEYHGNVQGHMLLQQGMDPSLIPDLDRDYAVQTWIVGRHTLKVQLNPSPRQRIPYYITSFEKVPGTVHGHSIPDIIEDVQDMANATVRALVNNMSIASGPQVVINDDCLPPTANSDELYPWKRWHVQNDPLGNPKPPVTFFQPQSNAQELLAIYQALNSMADDLSAIPRYNTGGGTLAGAGRTSSGLSMMMGNASKVLQTVAGNVDNDVMEPALTMLYDMIMLTDTTGILTGEEQVRVGGVNVAMQKETERQKQLQFLQITGNPSDAAIVGEVGRGRLLRAVSSGMGLPDDIVPDDDALATQAKAKQDAQAQQAALATWLAMHGIKPGPPTQGVQGELLALPGPPEPGMGPSPAAQQQGDQPPQATPEQPSDHAPPTNSFQNQRGVIPNG